MSNDFEIYNGKTFYDLSKEIFDRSQSKKDQIDSFLTEMRKHISDKNDAMMFFPHLKDLLIVGVKNDEQLVKLAAVLQKAQTPQEDLSGGSLLSDEEKEQLLKSHRDNISKELIEIKNEVNSVAPISSSFSKK